MCGIADEPANRPTAVVFQTFEQIFVFDSGGDELHAIGEHFREQFFSRLVDEGHVGEVEDDAGAGDAAGLAPAGSELGDPRAGEAAAELPALSGGVV